MAAESDELDDRPRILGVRFGANPNSSSLGVDVTFLLFGGVAALSASLFLSAWLRSRKKSNQVVGEADAKPALSEVEGAAP